MFRNLRLSAAVRVAALLIIFLTLAAPAATGPIRVLYFDATGGEQTTLGPLHDAMRELGRDAIWFDYTTGATPSAADLIPYDALVVRPKADGSPALNGRIKLPTGESVGVIRMGSNVSAERVRMAVLATVGDARRKDWEKFLTQREPEKREESPTVANYEKRPAAVTFQHPFSVKGSKERTQVPADMHLELFASEPQIGKPIAFAWDERGRLWVAETRDYPHDVKRDGMGNDRIVICEDTDGDGRADKFTVFADHLNIPTALVFAHGGVIVSQSPRFLFLKDSNGDDKADIREEIITGWGIRDTHATANNLHYGLDNWLYGCVGYSGFDGKVRGVTKKFTMGTYRFKADGSALEFLHQFSNNAWGHSANDAGDQFGGTANNAPIFFGGIPATVVPAGVRVMTAKRINVQDKCHPITPNFRQVDVFGGYTAAAGSAFISSANLPPRLQGKAMVCEPTMKLIALMDVQPDGAGYVAKDGYNLVASSDEWMSPVFAEVGPDGAAWFADWQNFIIQHNPTPSVDRGGYPAKTGVGGAHENPLRDHARGRIYRVVWNDAKKPAITSLKDASAPQLVAALGDSTQLWRLTAQRLLVEGKRMDAVASLKNTVTNNSGIAAIHALWTLHGLGKLDDATHIAALTAKDAALRRNAVRALGADEHAHKLFFSSGVMSDPNPTTKLAAFVKLAEFPTKQDIQTLVASIARNPANRADDWLSDAARLLARKHKTELFKEGPNLLPNSGFEIVGKNDLPDGWTRRDYGKREGNADAEWKIVKGAGQSHGGSTSVRCITRDDGDTSLHADVAVKPNTQYRLSGWIKTHALKGKASLNDHLGRAETERVTARESDWAEVDVVFNSGTRTTASINLLHVGKGDSYFGDVKFCEVVSVDDAVKLTPGDVKRGENIVFKHAAACILCHTIKGQGSTVGPVLDGIATRGTKEYIRESLLEPNKVLAKGYEQLGISPMPPMGDIFGPQELEDIQAYLQTLK
ncbi:MAG: c-type cytochrome [Verrucomicrobia bacterium]|nr:c-type cytochrome [Verrucomicrobiota bacterium]